MIVFYGFSGVYCDIKYLHETPTTKSEMATMSHLFQLSST